MVLTRVARGIGLTRARSGWVCDSFVRNECQVIIILIHSRVKRNSNGSAFSLGRSSGCGGGYCGRSRSSGHFCIILKFLLFSVLFLVRFRGVREGNCRSYQR
jgi:hypothetical protein